MAADAGASARQLASCYAKGTCGLAQATRLATLAPQAVPCSPAGDKDWIDQAEIARLQTKPCRWSSFNVTGLKAAVGAWMSEQLTMWVRVIRLLDALQPA